MVSSAPVSGPHEGFQPVTSSGEPLANALHRLAAKAHAEGVRIIDDLGASPFACRVTSSRPGHEPYVVNLAPGMLHGCDCEGYFRWQRCKHYALCLELAGWLPEVADTEGAPERAPVLAAFIVGDGGPFPAPGERLMHQGRQEAQARVAVSRTARRAHAAADLAVRSPSQHPARPEDVGAVHRTAAGQAVA